MIHFDLEHVSATIENFIMKSNAPFVGDIEADWYDLQQEETFKYILRALEIKNSPEQDFDSPKKFHDALRRANKELLMQISFEIGVLFGATLWRNES